MIKFNCQKVIYNLKLISNIILFFSKVNISFTFNSKVMKSPPKKYHSSRAFPYYQEFVPISLKI